MRMKPKICLTFDVEEWTVPQDYGATSKWNNEIKFSKEGCKKLIKLLRRHRIKSTFFITGYFAEKEEKIVKELANEGHEIASHGYVHRDLTKLSIKDLKKEVSKSTDILEDIIREGPLGFRAPYLSINETVLDVLSSLKYRYDSSLTKVKFSKSFKINKILEIPISVFPVVKVSMSWLWMRNLGLWWTRLGSQMNLKQNKNVILFFHPWEFVDLPRIKGLPFYITKNTGDRFLRKLDLFIKACKDVEFGKLIDSAKL